MPRISSRSIWIAAVALSIVAVQLVGPSRGAQVGTAPPSATARRASRDDRAVLRRELLARLDARIDEIATRSRLELRLALDEVLPVPYLGVDSEPKDGGLALIAVYADTGAERCELRKGDVVRTFAGVRVDSKAALASAVRSHDVGDRVEVEFERAGSPMTVQATLGPRPEEDEDEDEQFPDLIAPITPPPAPLTFAFDGESVGSLPATLASVLGGHGAPGSWSVVKSDAGLALRQCDADKTGIRFPMVIVRDFSAKDSIARVRFRYVGGRVDRAAGIMLRFRDPGNYLVARANAAEGDLRIFRVVNGDRRTLPGAIAKGATEDERWHTLEFRVEGSTLSAVLDDTVRATAQDTFFAGGGVGLWTKSDSLTEFDDLRVEATK